MNPLEFLDECKIFLWKIFLQMASGLKSTFSKQKSSVHALQHLNLLLKDKLKIIFPSSGNFGNNLKNHYGCKWEIFEVPHIWSFESMKKNSL